MQADDLTRLKYIGPARRKTLHTHGILTFAQLVAIPLEALSRIPTIGPFYGKGIKDAVMAMRRAPRSGQQRGDGERRTLTTRRPPSPQQALRRQLDRIAVELRRLDTPPRFDGAPQALVRFAAFKQASDRFLRHKEPFLQGCAALPAATAWKIARSARRVKKKLKKSASPIEKKRLPRRLARLTALLRLPASTGSLAPEQAAGCLGEEEPQERSA
jgi:hypothetical protein